MFVKQLDSPRSRNSAAVRKWSVRKLRRRPRSRDGRRKPVRNKPKLEVPVESQNTETEVTAGSSTTLENTKEKADFEPSEKSEVLLFGKNLDKEPIEETIDLSSDDDSTGGEGDDDIAGKFWSHHSMVTVKW
jgi:Arf-GAP/coiled-coil/ANK repeat/PH domain-containing protein